MNILIIEDDEFKCESIVALIQGVFDSPEIIKATNVRDAVKCIDDHIYDLVVIDMAIPSHPTIKGGGTPLPRLTGGLDIILELKHLGRSDPCVIVTQYPDIEIGRQFFSIDETIKEVSDQLGYDLLGCVLYSHGQESWKLALGEVLRGMKPL